MKILITGGQGQLGREFPALAKENLHIYNFSSNDLDITDAAQTQQVIEQVRPDVIIHCAAYTNVDGCESNPDDAFKVNALGARNVAVAANKIGAKMVYISTDYVFDGINADPYQEYAKTNPQSIYGKSKLYGEELVRHTCPKHFIVRTSWVFGIHGNNFVKTIIRIALEQPELKVVADQFGAPTYAKDLAEKVLELVETEKYGIYHITNQGSCSWFEFTKSILAEIGAHTPVYPITTEELNRPAPRPQYSVLDNYCLSLENLGLLRPWPEALKAFITEYRSENGRED